MNSKRTSSLRAWTIVGLAIVSLLWAVPAQGANERGVGIAVSFPVVTYGPIMPATALLDIIAQGQISEELINRLDLRLFFHTATGFRPDLTAVRNTLSVLFDAWPVQLTLGGGAGVYPIRSAANPTRAGFLVSLLARLGLEIRVDSFGFFIDVAYETMPQPFADIDSTAGGLVISSLQVSMGTLIHF